MATTQFNAHSFESVGVDVTNAAADAFTPDSNEIYIVKGLRFTNYSAGSITIHAQFYSGSDTTSYWMLKDHTLTAGSSYDVLSNAPVTISGVAGDRLKVYASSNSVAHAVITMMGLGRQTGL